MRFFWAVVVVVVSVSHYRKVRLHILFWFREAGDADDEELLRLRHGLELLCQRYATCGEGPG